MYSFTYSGIIVMLLSWICSKAGVQIGNDQITAFVDTFGLLIGAVVAFYGRYRAGGISILGRKL